MSLRINTRRFRFGLATLLGRRRGFFIVDRTLVEDGYVPENPPTAVGTFDFRKFIIYRKTIQ